MKDIYIVEFKQEIKKHPLTYDCFKYIGYNKENFKKFRTPIWKLYFEFTDRLFPHGTIGCVLKNSKLIKVEEIDDDTSIYELVEFGDMTFFDTRVLPLGSLFAIKNYNITTEYKLKKSKEKDNTLKNSIKEKLKNKKGIVYADTTNTR